MSLSRREFLHMLGMASAGGLLSNKLYASDQSMYDIGSTGDVRIMHITDVHGQLSPVYFREPNVNLGLGAANGRPPHIVGEELLKFYGIAPNTPEAHAFSYLDFDAAAQKYGKVGGYAHLATLVKQLRAEAGDGNSLLLDGGDSWQGHATNLWTNGQDMMDAMDLLGVDIMTAHWEATYGEERMRELLNGSNVEFVAQNIIVDEVAMFDGAEAYDEDTGHAFKPYTIKERGGKRIAVVGQAFPYTPIANPQRFIPNWSYGIRHDALQELVDDIRANEQVDAVILLSHNGMDVDIKLAEVVSGIDAIMGGHTHDGMPAPIIVENAGGKTLVTNGGSNGKFVGVLDLKFSGNKVSGYEYRLLPVFANMLDADAEMQAHIDAVRAPFADKLGEVLCRTDALLYRRGNFNGTWDQVICDAMVDVLDAQIALSPGFRWGPSSLAGSEITMEDLMGQTAMTYPETYVQEMTGETIKVILEDVADNLFHEDPFYQQGGDMVRTSGMSYRIDPTQTMGKRIDDMRLSDGSLIEADKTYKVSGWATVGSVSPGAPIWDVAAEYLRAKDTLTMGKPDTPEMVGVDGNPGVVEL
ncbi:MAG: thiosulfohydrolase SoxB [Gammaproteobacteria bacterium]|nr:thiosulfohydrolase SoxB [Gammaproteobacteria bacterium]